MACERGFAFTARDQGGLRGDWDVSFDILCGCPTVLVSLRPHLISLEMYFLLCVTQC